MTPLSRAIAALPFCVVGNVAGSLCRWPVSVRFATWTDLRLAALLDLVAPFSLQLYSVLYSVFLAATLGYILGAEECLTDAPSCE